MDRLEKLQKICNARFQKLFESADQKEFERRKAKWLRSEALVDIERGQQKAQTLGENTSSQMAGHFHQPM